MVRDMRLNVWRLTCQALLRRGWEYMAIRFPFHTPFTFTYSVRRPPVRLLKVVRDTIEFWVRLQLVITIIERWFSALKF